MREGVRAYLTSHSISVVGDAADAEEALRKVKKAKPDVVVLDVNLPRINGGELARRLRRLIPKAKLIAFSIHSSQEYVAWMARCGVQGYVTKDRPTVELLEAIRDVFKGGKHFPAVVTDELSAPAPMASPGSLTEAASPRSGSARRFGTRRPSRRRRPGSARG